jgi:hypothetical protein
MKTKEEILNLYIIRTHKITFNNKETICQQNIRGMQAFRPDYLPKAIHKYD